MKGQKDLKAIGHTMVDIQSPFESNKETLLVLWDKTLFKKRRSHSHFKNTKIIYNAEFIAGLQIKNMCKMTTKLYNM